VIGALRTALLDQLRAIIPPVRSVLDFGLLHASAPPLSFAPLQTLLWLATSLLTALSSSSSSSSLPVPSSTALVLPPTGSPAAVAVSEADSTARLLAQLPLVAQDVSAQWHAFAASNAFVRLHSVYDKLGSAALDLPLQSTLISSLVHSSDQVSLLNRHAKISQLQLLAQTLTDQAQAKRSAVTDTSATELRERTTEWLSLASVFAQTVSCFQREFATAEWSLVAAFLYALHAHFAAAASSAAASAGAASPLHFAARVMSPLPKSALIAQCTAVMTALRSARDKRFASLVDTLVRPALVVIGQVLTAWDAPHSVAASVRDRQLRFVVCFLSFLLPLSR
jgi:hypothetical protein